MVLALKKHNINQHSTSFSITFYILVILFVEIKIQMIENLSKLKYSFNAFVLIYISTQFVS
jgi:hypothetical protein